MERPEVVVEALGPHMISLHLKAFDVHRASHAMGLSVDGTAAGDGLLDIPWLLAQLAAWVGTRMRCWNCERHRWPT